MKACIDPGHGGYDPGACGNGLEEKDITLDIALHLRSLLIFNGIEVIMTRDGDYAPGHFEGDQNEELWARVKIAEAAKADLFVSVHVNSSAAANVGTGAEVLIQGTGGRAAIVAEKVLPYIVQVGAWANRKVKTQNVMVLRETSMPAILTENGFINTAADANKLKNLDFQKALAVAHAKGICDYFEVKYKELEVVIPAPSPTLNIMYRVILDDKQTMALGSQDAAIAEVKKAVNADQAQRGSVQRNTDRVNVFEYAKTQTTTSIPAMPPVQPPAPTVAPKTAIMAENGAIVLLRNVLALLLDFFKDEKV